MNVRYYDKVINSIAAGRNLAMFRHLIMLVMFLKTLGRSPISSRDNPNGNLGSWTDQMILRIGAQVFICSQNTFCQCNALHRSICCIYISNLQAMTLIRNYSEQNKKLRDALQG